VAVSVPPPVRYLIFARHFFLSFFPSVSVPAPAGFFLNSFFIGLLVFSPLRPPFIFSRPLFLLAFFFPLLFLCGGSSQPFFPFFCPLLLFFRLPFPSFTTIFSGFPRASLPFLAFCFPFKAQHGLLLPCSFSPFRLFFFPHFCQLYLAFYTPAFLFFPTAQYAHFSLTGLFLTRGKPHCLNPLGYRSFSVHISPLFFFTNGNSLRVFSQTKTRFFTIDPFGIRLSVLAQEWISTQLLGPSYSQWLSFILPFLD